MSAVMLALSAAPGAASDETPAEALVSRLAAGAAHGRVLFGHHDDPVYGHEWTGETGRSDVLEATGQYPAVMRWDLGGMEKGDTLNLDGVPFSRMRSEAIAQHRRGGVNTFSWHPALPLGKGTSWDTSDATAVRRIMTGEAEKKWFADAVGAMADFFNSLRDERGEKIAVIFRPWHEHTGSWFWWGADWCTPEQYRALWHETHRIMDTKGADNVVWAYSPDRVKDTVQYLERYPGDEYVDIMGTDVYHFNGAEGTDAYVEAATKSLTAVTEAARSHGKIAAFTETGLEALPIADWYTSTLLPIIRSFPVAYVTVWRNAYDNKNHYYTPYEGHPAMEDFRKFHEDPATVFVSK